MKTAPIIVEGKPYRLICPDWDFRKDPKTDHFCAICQKDIKPGQPYREVHIVDGGSVILHPADEALYAEHGNPAGDLCFFPIGSTCAKRLGLEWSKPVSVEQGAK
jgi:hypothetical protein